MMWHCPVCRARLAPGDSSLDCAHCRHAYPVIDQIPDLRHPALETEETRRDRETARARAAAGPTASSGEMLRQFFASREGSGGWTGKDTDVRTRQSLAAPGRLGRELTAWLQPTTERGVLLDVGCGLGGLLAASAARGIAGVGIDNRLTALVVARRLIADHGDGVLLACANAEALPLADESVGGVVFYDVVEHVQDLERVLREANRVTRAGGVLACSTPNRFSLTPEPHVGLWGVGWMPRKYQAVYVTWRSGRPYEGTVLRSVRELRLLLRRVTDFEPVARVPAIPEDEIRASGAARRLLARTYNRVLTVGLINPVLLRLGPFYQVQATKRTR